MNESNAHSKTNEAIERVLHIAQLRAEVESATGTPIISEDGFGGSLEAQEAFWSNIHAIETAPYRPLRSALLEQHGLSPVPPAQLTTDDELHQALWKLLDTLASMRIFFHFTDHLSDRAFYTLLLEEVLPEETQIMPVESGWNCRYDMTDFPTTDTPEDNGIYLKYYADDMERDYWSGEWPEEHMPAQAKLPYDRDRRLPVPPEEVPPT